MLGVVAVVVLEEVYEKITNNESRLAKIETTLDEHSRLLQKQEEKNDVQTKLNTILELQLEADKKRDIQMEKFEQTLNNVNDNLTSMNSKQELLDQRITGIENTINESKKSVVKVLIGSWKYIGSIAIGIALAILYKKLGI